MALSKNGRYLATGQVTYMGFTADIIVWDLESRQLLHRMGLHKVHCPCVKLVHAHAFAHARRQGYASSSAL